MAKSLGLSRSVLYQMFRSDGGVVAYDRLRRLRALYRALCDTSERRSIAELGAEQGFLDKASLARSFRAAFGCSPQMMRNGVRDNQQQLAGSEADIIRQAVDRLA